MKCRVFNSGIGVGFWKAQAIRRAKWTLLCIGVTLTCNGWADAALITYSFSGTLNDAYANINGPGPVTTLPGVISGLGSGQAYTGTFSFDDQAPAAYSALPGEQFDYTWSVGTITFDIGGYLYSFIRYGTPGENQTISLGVIVPSGDPNIFAINGQDGGSVLLGQNFSEVSFGLEGTPGFISSTSILAGMQFNPSLLVSSPGTSGVDLIEQFPSDPGASFVIDARITSISLAGSSSAVPEPTTLVLFGQAALFAGVLRRRAANRGRRRRDLM